MNDAEHLVLPMNYRNSLAVVRATQDVLDTIPVHVQIQPQVTVAYPLASNLQQPAT